MNEDTIFYHGSLSNLDDGEILVPGCECQKGDYHSEVYITPLIHLAQQFATYEGWIYMVEPIGEVTIDLELENQVVSCTCAKAKVLACVW